MGRCCGEGSAGVETGLCYFVEPASGSKSLPGAGVAAMIDWRSHTYRGSAGKEKAGKFINSMVSNRYVNPFVGTTVKQTSNAGHAKKPLPSIRVKVGD